MKEYSINRWRLTFENSEIEAEYVREEEVKNIKQQRFAYAVSIPFYLAFAPVDYVQAGAYLPLFWFIRFGIYLPLGIAVYLSTFHHKYTLYAQKLASLLVYVGGLGMMVMTLAGARIDFYSYKYGFLFTLLFATSLLKLRFLNVLKVTLPMLLLYTVISTQFKLVPMDVNVDSMIVYVVAVAMGCISSYFFESSERKQFVLRKMMTLEKEKVAHTNLVLEEKVKERTQHLNEVVQSLMEANQKLKTSEVTFRKLFENASDAVLLLRQEAILNCNQECVSLLKYFHKSDLIGKTLDVIAPLDTFAEFEVEGQNDKVFKSILMLKTGDAHLFELKVTPIILDGEAVKYCVIKPV